MANVYIVTKQGKTYNDEGVEYVLDCIRNTFHDYSDVHLFEGPLHNTPSVLADFLKDDPGHSYVFISHNKGIEIMYRPDSINRYIEILEANTDENETSWTLIMEALGLLS